ncbi:MAX dimerization protein MGA a isoform X2 [Engraulis encrasicolus]|uniref:MAX dimerization protein MGA a isoform X2 n=1 Tax=Engraulis encrasicolus TaxID=184585 RepID=UPI002FD35D8B
MAEKKQAVMVLREDGATASAVAPTSAATTSFFVGPKSGQTMEGGGAHGALEANGEAAAATKASLGFVAASPHAVTSILSPDLVSNHHPENLPPEATSKGITVTLDNNNMWNEFFRCKTEMILTKQGRRMFPTCRYRLSGMEPFQRYLLVMDIIPMDNHRYRWTDHRWEPNGKSEAHVTGRVFIHQDSPAAGHYWMGNPVSFYKLKLTNTVTDTDGHIVLHSMHRYLPRLHIVPADKPTDVIDIDSPDVMTFSFPQTEFFAVTAYLNLSITQLKIDYNPFAKGFREDATNSRSVVPKLGSPSTSAGSGGKNSLSPINSLKALFAKKVPVEKNKEDDPTRKQRDVDGKEGNAQLSATTDKSTVKRRPSTLSELFQGTPLKLRKTAPESGARKTAPESAGPRIILHKIDGGCANARSTLGSKKELAVQNPTLLKSVVNLTRLKSVESSIQSKPVENPTLLKSAAKDSFPLNGKSNEDFGSTSTSADAMTGDCSVTKGKNGEKVLNASSEENTGTDTRVGDSEKQSQSKSASQKLPSAKALPLLALFFQQLKSKSKPVKAAPKPDVTGSDAANEERSSPTTNVALAPSSTQHTESCTEPGDTHTSTLTPVSANKTVENTALEAPSELRIPPQMSESVSETLPKMQTSLQSPPTHTSPQSTTAVFPKLDMSLTATNPDEANPQAMTTSASGDPVDFVDQPVPDAPLSPLSPLSPSEFAVAFSPPSSPDFWPCSPLPVFTPEPLDPPANQKALLDPSANHNPLLDPPANHNLFDPPANHNPLLDPPANHNPLLDPPASRSLLPDPPSITSDIPPMSDPEDEDGDADGDRDADGDTNSGTGDITTGIGGTGVASLVINANNQLSAAGKAKARSRKKGRRNKQVEEEPVVGGPTDVRMQPNLEDVEGQLFVSFTSKEALSIHLSDQSEEAQPPSQKSPDVVEAKVVESPESTAERIASLEKALLQDLKVMKYKQVIHPVLQEVGLKLNILDQILAIDLVYLGVELPIPPASQSLVSSSQPPFISRTGKTTDVTKIKGWRDKFVTTDSQESQPEAGPSSDATMTAASTSSTDAASSAMKNRSAFCSDMLDEYLANEGKLIDERAASFSTSSVTPVAYQMPTKSSSYVRTLDSVLKKRAPPSVPFSYNSSSSSFTTTTTTTMSGSRKTPASKQSTSATQNKKSKAPSKPKETQKLSSGGGGRKSSRTTTPKETSSTTSSTTSTTKAATKSSTSLETPKSISSSLLTKTSAPKLKNSTKTITPAVVKPPAPETTSSAKDSPKVESRAVVNRVPPVVKLLEVEDGAVWEGQERTYVTEERASIALAALATATGFNAPTLPIIVRRAPPCLQAHCRLGCVCTSLALERRHHHCGKPECMLGCHCLRHKVVLRRKSEGDKEVKEEPKSPVVVEIVTESEEGSIKSLKKKKKKKKRRKSLAYVVTDPQVTSEPATRVQTLWNGQGVDTDKDMLCIPTPAPALPCPIPYGLNDMYGLHDESMTCARIRPFENKASEETQQKDVSMQSIEDVSLEPETEIRLESETHDSEEGSEQYESGQVNEPEPGELTHGPSKRLEVVSDCKWERRSDCAYIMRMLCQHMDKDRLKTPFWIGKYRIQPLSQTVVDEGQGPCTNYKVHISMPQLVKGKIHTAPDSNKLSPAPTPTLSLTLTPSLTSTPSLMPEPPAAMAETTPEESRTASLQEAQPEPKPKPKPKPKGSLAPLKPVELLPPLRPEEGLPFLAGVPEAGTLVAKEPDEKGCGVMVNGKAYPKARLQLGHMGALHPANRLAAYLTGRLDPANLPGYTKSRLQVASTPPPPGPPTTTSSIAVVTVVNTAATSTTKTTVASSGVKVAQPAVGKVYTQFVLNQLCGRQTVACAAAAGSTPGNVQKVVITSTPMVVVGKQAAGAQPQIQTQNTQGAGVAKGPVFVTLAPPGKQGPLGTQVATPVTTTVTTTTTATATGGTLPAHKVLQILAEQSQQQGAQSAGLAGSAVLPGSATTVRTRSIFGQSVGQVMLQQVRTKTGATLYRNPNGQLVQLVPLSQLRNLKHNIVIRDQRAYVRLPTPHNAGLPPTQKDGSSSSISTPGGAPVPATPVSSSSVTAPSGETPCITTTSAGIGTTTTTTSTATTSSPTTCTSTVQSKMVKIVPIRGSAAFNINTGSQALKEAPEFLGEPGTHTMTIFPKSRSVPGQSTQGASKGFTLLQPPGASAAKELEVLSKPSPSVVSASSEVDEKSAVTDASDTPKATSMQDEEPSSSDAEFSDEDSYLSSPSSPSKDAPPEDKTAEGNAHQSSTAGGEISIVDSSLDVTPMSPDICEVEIGGDDDDDGDDNDDEDDDECVIVSKKSAVIEAGEISSDVEIVGDLVVLSDDSDSDSDVESINVISDSGDTELSDDDSVDIETVDDSAASFRQMHKQNRGTGRTGMGSVTHCYNERMRRNAMRDSFAKLHLLLNIDDPKAARVRIILEATKAIRQLEGQERSLQIEKEALEKKQKEYVSRIAKASGKSPEVILEKLHDISSRQKKVEQQRKRKQLFTELAEKLTVRPPVSNRDTPPPAAATIRTPIPTRARSPSVVTPILSSASSRTSSAFSSRSSSPASRSHSPVPSRSPSPVHTDSPGRLTQTRSPVRSCSPSSPRTLSPVRAHSPMAATRTPLVATATEPVNAESRASRPPLRTYRPAQTQRNPTAVPPPEKRMRVMPNILSKKAKVPEPTPPKVTTTPTPTPLRLNTQVFSIISPMLQGQKIVSLDKPVGTLVKPVGTLVPVPIVPLSTLTTHKSMTPGVAAVTIRVPAGQQVVQVAGSQLRKPETQGSVQPPKEAKAAGNNVGLPKIMNVMSLVAPVNQVLHPTTKAPPVVPKVFPKAAQIRVLNDVLPRVTNAVQAQVINALPHWLRGALPPRVPDTVPSQVTNTPVPQVPGTVPSDVANEVTVSSDPATSTPQGAPESPGMDTLEDMAEADGPLDFVRKFAANLAASVELEGVEAEEQKGDEGAEGKERKEEGEGGGKEREQQEEGGEEAKEDATQEERGGGGEGEEGGGEEDDNTLMSLLNEIAFLNQQSSSDCPAQACTPSYTRPPEPGEVLGNRPARLDEERSPSPLVLRLDYDGDHTPSTTSTSTPLTKPITTDAPGTPVTNNSGGHSFTETPMKAAAASVSGSTPPLTPAPLLSSATNGQPEAAGAGNGESLTPPPLLQMKTGHVAPPVMPTFRPMPKLVPLGLKGTPQTPAGRESGSPP